MLFQSVTLHGPDINFTCAANGACRGNDAATKQIFQALQAQINRFAISASQSSSNPGLWKKMILAVTGDIDKVTVNTYKLLAAGLASMGMSPPVGEKQATTQSLAERADEIARFLQDGADRAGLPPGTVSLSTGGGFGPTSSSSSADITPDSLRRITDAALAPPSPIVSFVNKLPGAQSRNGKIAWAIGGAAVVLGLGYWLFSGPRVAETDSET